MKMLVNIINYILFKFNYGIFSKLSCSYLRKKVWESELINYCGYHKNFKIDDWRFSENKYRKNVKYLKLQIRKLQITDYKLEIYE
jgi:hypothetical protein